MRSTALLLTILFACGKDVAPVDPAVPPDGPPEPPPTPFTECDSEPTAFIRDAFLAITGRRPLGQAEVDVYKQVWTQAEAQGLDPRTTVSTALTNTPAFAVRWESALMDAVRVQRINEQSMAGCWSFTNITTVTPNLAQHLRDTDATSGTAPPLQGDATMLDVTRSALALDDLSVIYRAQLFNLTSLPTNAANASPPAAELARRADVGATFDSAWTRRDSVCLRCHNSENSVTDSDDPALDRHFPVPGLPEKAVFGDSTGVGSARAHGVFRIDGFLGGGLTPWGMSSSCGSFADPTSIGNDVANVDTKLASLTGRRTTVFGLDAVLHKGFNRLRGNGPTLTNGAITDPDEALAWLVTLAMVDETWKEIVGSSLTIANGFPRNAATSELLSKLATELAKSNYSLKHLVIEITKTDFFSRLAPEAGCGTAYSYPAVFDPWTTSEADTTKRGNGPGDAVAWLSPRTMAIAASAALWNGTVLVQPFPNEFPNGAGPNVDSADFHRSVGVYLRNSEPGFRGLSFQARLAWEDRFGSCAKPDATGDFIDEVLAGPTAGATVKDVVLAVKDRVISEPIVHADEESALATLLGSLASPASNVDEDAVRHYCGILLGSPQFALTGVPGRDGDVPLLTPASARTTAVCNRLNAVSIGGGKHVECTADVISIVAD